MPHNSPVDQTRQASIEAGNAQQSALSRDNARALARDIATADAPVPATDQQTDHKSTCRALVPASIGDVQVLAKMMSMSSLLPQALRGHEADVAVTIMAGMELGMPPMAALRSIHVVQGRPVLSADLLVACAHSSPVCEYFRCVESTATVATYETKRRGDQPTVRTWTWEDATRAGLVTKDNWRKYPAAMLRARCKADLARDVYPDTVSGVYTPDEASDFAPSTAIDAEFSEVSVPAPATRVAAPPVVQPPVKPSAKDLALDELKVTLRQCWPGDTVSMAQAAQHAYGCDLAAVRDELEAREIAAGIPKLLALHREQQEAAADAASTAPDDGGPMDPDEWEESRELPEVDLPMAPAK